MPSPLSGFVAVIDCFLIGLIAGAGWACAEGLVRMIRILLGGH